MAILDSLIPPSNRKTRYALDSYLRSHRLIVSLVTPWTFGSLPITPWHNRHRNLRWTNAPFRIDTWDFPTTTSDGDPWTPYSVFPKVIPAMTSEEKPLGNNPMADGPHDTTPHRRPITPSTALARLTETTNWIKLLTRHSASRDGLWDVTGSALKTLRNQLNFRLCTGTPLLRRFLIGRISN